MKLTFEGNNVQDLIDQVGSFLGSFDLKGDYNQREESPERVAAPDPATEPEYREGVGVADAEEPIFEVDRAAVKFRFAALVNSDYEKAEKLLDDLGADKFDDVSDAQLGKLAKAIG